MTRKLIYTPDAAGEYTIAEESENWMTDIGQVENESDARLFCAAPNLLAVIQRLVPLYESLLTDCGLAHKDMIDDARAAIAKALGETK